MKIHILGTGAATVTKYINTAAVLEENGEYFLIDGTGGTDILRCFEAHGIDWCKLHEAFLTHEHTDHFLGMVWAIRMVAELMELDEYEGEFRLYGHNEVLAKIDRLCRMILKSSSQRYLDERIHFVPVENHERLHIWNHDFTFFDIQSVKAKQFGFLMEYDGKKLLYAGDEPLSENGRMYCNGADWFFSEAFCLFDEEPQYHAYQYNHQTVKEAALIAQEQQVVNLVIWHTEDGTYDRRKELYSAEAARYYDGNIYVPDDGEIIEL